MKNISFATLLLFSLQFLAIDAAADTLAVPGCTTISSDLPQDTPMIVVMMFFREAAPDATIEQFIALNADDPVLSEVNMETVLPAGSSFMRLLLPGQDCLNRLIDAKSTDMEQRFGCALTSTEDSLGCEEAVLGSAQQVAIPTITPYCEVDPGACITVSVKEDTTPVQEFGVGLQSFFTLNGFGPEFTGDETISRGEFTFRLN